MSASGMFWTTTTNSLFSKKPARALCSGRLGNFGALEIVPDSTAEGALKSFYFSVYRRRRCALSLPAGDVLAHAVRRDGEGTVHREEFPHVRHVRPELWERLLPRIS